MACPPTPHCFAPLTQPTHTCSNTLMVPTHTADTAHTAPVITPIIAVDCGNSRIKVALFDNGEIVAHDALPTADAASHLAEAIRTLVQAATTPPTHAIVASVVPAAVATLGAAVQQGCGLVPALVPDDTGTPVPLHVDHPKEVGPDRMVAVYGAAALLGVDTLVVVDYGTATTFDVLERGAFTGGLICPGMQVSATALTDRAARLPQVQLAHPGPFAHGTNTADNLTRGFMHGFAAMTRGLADDFRATLGPDVPFVATGGFAPLMHELTGGLFARVEPDLVLHGLARMVVATTGNTHQ